MKFTNDLSGIWHAGQIGAWLALRRLHGINPHVRIFVSIRKEAYQHAAQNKPQFSNLRSFRRELRYRIEDIKQIIENNIAIVSKSDLVNRTAKIRSCVFSWDEKSIRFECRNSASRASDRLLNSPLLVEAARRDRHWQGDQPDWHEGEKIEAARRAVALAAICQDPAERVAGICLLTSGLIDAGRLDEAESADEMTLGLCRQYGMFESQRYAKVAEVHAFVAVRRGRFEEARRSYTEALLLTLRFGNAVAATSLRHNLAELELLLGNAARALELATAAADGARRMRFGRFEAISLTNVAACSLALSDAGGARKAAHDALDLAQGAYPWAAIVAIQHLATVAALGAAPQRGALLRGYVNAWYRARGCEPDVAEARGQETLMAALRERLSESQIVTSSAEGALLTEEEATLEALEI